MSMQEIFVGFLLKELSNRFLCLVEVNGKEEICYIPCSTKLSKYFSIKKKKKVLLTLVKGNKAKTRYSLFAIKQKQYYVLVNLAYANTIILNALSSRAFSFLGKRNSPKAEFFVLPDYRADLYIEHTKTVIEIKTIIGNQETIFYPNVDSDHFIKQLKKIEYLLLSGYKVCYLFCVLTPSIKRVIINSSYREFTKLFYNCLSLGMIVKCRRIKFKKNRNDFFISNQLKINL